MTPAPAPVGRSGPVRPDDDSWQPGAAANAGPRTVPRPAQNNERLHRNDTERHSRETDSSGGEEPEVGAESTQELERTWGSLDRFLYTKCRGGFLHLCLLCTIIIRAEIWRQLVFPQLLGRDGGPWAESLSV